MLVEDIGRYGLSEGVISKITTVFFKVPEVQRVVLYGSRAMGTYNNGSDIDLVIQGELVSHQQLLAMVNEIDDLLLPYEIDLSLMHRIDNQDLLDHISRVGVVIYEPDSS